MGGFQKKDFNAVLHCLLLHPNASSLYLLFTTAVPSMLLAWLLSALESCGTSSVWQGWV